MFTEQIKSLTSAYDWITSTNSQWIETILMKAQGENTKLLSLLDVIMNKTCQMCCIDTEYFIGKYQYNQTANDFYISDDIAIGRLYNVGLATFSGINI